MKYGIVNAQGLIENAIVLDEGSVFEPDAGYTLVRIDNVENCGIGWTYINGVFTEPAQEAPQPQPVVEGAQTL